MGSRLVGIIAILAASVCLSFLTAPVTFKKTTENVVVATPAIPSRIGRQIEDSVDSLSSAYPPYFLLYQESSSNVDDPDNIPPNDVYLSSVSEGGKVQIWHQWENRFNTVFGSRGFLLETGYVLLTGSMVADPESDEAEKNDSAFTPGAYDFLQILDADGSVVWEYLGCFPDEKSTQECLHHDIHPMKNGNILITAYKRYNSEELLKRGYRWRPSEDQTHLLLDVIYEIRPYYGKAVASCSSANRWCTKVVWRWELADHIGDFDPGKITLNYINIDSQTRTLGDFEVKPIDQSLITSIAYDSKRDEILLTANRHNEVWVVDHSISTASAIGKAGDLVYRWGNPANYSVAEAKARQPAQLAKIVDAKWGPDGETLLLLGNTIMSEGSNDTEARFGAEVLQVPLPLNQIGEFVFEGDSFGPKLAWSLYGPQQEVSRGHLTPISNNEYILARSPRTLQKFRPRAQDTNGNMIAEQIVWTTAMPPTGACQIPGASGVCAEIADLSVIARDSTKLTNFRKRVKKKGLSFAEKKSPR